MRTHRMPPLRESERHFNDHISMGLTDEMHQIVYYRDLSKKGCLKNVLFKMRYIYKKYPYTINKKGKYYQYVIKNYFNLIDTGVKISKKIFIFWKK